MQTGNDAASPHLVPLAGGHPDRLKGVLRFDIGARRPRALGNVGPVDGKGQALKATEKRGQERGARGVVGRLGMETGVWFEQDNWEVDREIEDANGIISKRQS